jgi:Domain of unknown function (DUF4129)
MKGPRFQDWWAPLAVAVLLVLVGGAAAVATPQLTRVPAPGSGRARPALVETPPTAAVPSPSTSRSPQAARVSAPEWLSNVLIGLYLAGILVVVVIVVWLFARGRMRSRPGRLDEPHAAPVSSAEEVVAAVDAGLSDLSDTDLDPRRAVIACWVRLEQVAAAAGTPRQVSDTPTDLVTRLLGDEHVDPAVLAAFADTYRRARFATHAVDEQMRGQARAALERIRSALTGGRSTGVSA